MRLMGIWESSYSLSWLDLTIKPWEFSTLPSSISNRHIRKKDDENLSVLLLCFRKSLCRTYRTYPQPQAQAKFHLIKLIFVVVS